MEWMKRTAAFVLFISIMITPSMLFADGESREKTALERDWYIRIAEACGDAISGIECDWDVDFKSSEEENDRIGIGAEDYPLVHYFNITWKDHQRIDDAQTKTEEAMMQIQPGMQEQCEAIDTSSYEKLAEKIGAAAEAGNMAEVDRLSKEMEQATKQVEARIEPMNKDVKAVIEKHVPRDVTLSVRIKINQFNESFSDPVEVAMLKDGSPCYRLENGAMHNEGWVEGVTYVFLGNGWNKSFEDGITAFGHPDFSDNPHTEIRCVIVEVQAEKVRALKTLNSINLAPLKALINRN